NLKADTRHLEKLHIMPTCGTRYYGYDIDNKTWKQVYAEDFNAYEKQKIISEVKKAAEHLGLVEKKVYGEVIEDRGSQISWSALGQDIVDELGEEGIRQKEEWDPDNKKKLKMVKYLTPLLDEFEVRAGGTTTVDITKKGIDKAYGMAKLMEILDVKKEDIFFIGDK